MGDSNYGQYGQYAQYDQYSQFSNLSTSSSSSSSFNNHRPIPSSADTTSSSITFADQNFNSASLGSVYPLSSSSLSSSLPSSFTTPTGVNNLYSRSLNVIKENDDRDSNIYDNNNSTGSSSAIAKKGSTSSDIGEFTKRKNWPQRIIDEIRDFLHVLSPAGNILYCGPSTPELIGYTAEEMIGRNIVDFIHLDDIDVFLREFKMAVSTQKQLKVHYRFRKRNEEYIIFEVVGSPYSLENARKCIFAMGRPYFTKTTNLLDSFLEVKMENERLLQKICELRSLHLHDETTSIPGFGSNLDNCNSSSSSNTNINIDASININFSTGTLLGDSSSPSSGLNSSDCLDLSANKVHASHKKFFDHSHFSSESSILPSSSLQQQRRQRQMNMTNTKTQIPSTIFGTIRYGDEERAHESSVISANAQLQAATLALADLGVFRSGMGKEGEGIATEPISSASSTASSPLLMNEHHRSYSIDDGYDTTSSIADSGKEKGKGVSTRTSLEKRSHHKVNMVSRPKPRNKKMKMENNEYVCTDCGRTESPEWRKGPNGKKTLCNACGLRWAKKNKVPIDAGFGDEL